MSASANTQFNNLTDIVTQELEPKKIHYGRIFRNLLLLLIIAALIYLAYSNKVTTEHKKTKKAMDTQVVKYSQQLAEVDTKGYDNVIHDDAAKTATNSTLGIATSIIKNDNSSDTCPPLSIAPFTTDVDYTSVINLSNLGWNGDAPLNFGNQFLGYYLK